MQLCSLSEKEHKKKLLIPVPHNKEETSILIDQNNTTPNLEENENFSKTTVNNSQAPSSNTKKDNVQKFEVNSNLFDEKRENMSIQTQQNNTDSDLISITDELQAMNTEKLVETSKDNADNEWSEKQLLEKWRIFAQQLLEKQKINLHNMFDRYSPNKDNNNAIIQVVNLSEKSEIEEIKVELLSFLKKELNNDFINIIINISEDEDKNMLHTKEEKYKYILEKNNNIQLLTEKLNLTII
tara:strand:+ start:107 stop:826 length:720 start_codon:yes stop_codon:yes gene_type:complete